MLNIASLFSGVGTPEQSLKHLNIEHKTIFACEIDKYVRKTYLANNQEPEIFYEDVYNIDGKKYLNQIDILVGGSPCQSFSIAGKRLGTECPRGNLIYEYFRIVEESQPKVFIYENVKGFLSIDKGETFKNFVQSFKDLGYTVYHQVLNTKDYGIPQNRERIYIVGFKENIDFSFQEKQELKLRLKDMLEDEVDSKYFLNNTNINFMNTIWGKDTRWRKMKNPIDGCAGTICATHSKGLPRGVIINDLEVQKEIYKTGIANGLIEIEDNEVRVKEAVKQGYSVANEGDSINLSVPGSTTRRGRIGREVAQTLDTACNQAIFLKDNKNIDSNTKLWYNGVKKEELDYEKSTFDKGDTVKILQLLWEKAREEAFKKWGLGIIDSFQQEEILQQRLHGKELCKEREWKSGLFIGSLISKTDKQTFYREKLLPTMWKAWKSRCTSYRRKLPKQHRDEFNDSLQKLSYEITYSKSNMQNRKLQHESKRAWVLRKALSKVQKMGRSNESKETKKHNYIFRKLTERECFRLQGFDNSFIFPPKISSSQLYKQAGNGMSRNVLDMIFAQIFTCYTKYIEEKQNENI